MLKRALLCCIVSFLGLSGVFSLWGCQAPPSEAESIYSADPSLGVQPSGEDPVVSLAKWAIRNQREEDPLWGVSAASQASAADDFSIGNPLPYYQMGEQGVHRLGFDTFPVFNNGALIALLSFDKEGDSEGEKSAPRVVVDLPKEGGALMDESPCLLLLVCGESGSEEWLLSDEGEGILLSGSEPPSGDPRELVSRLGEEAEYVRQESSIRFVVYEND